MCQFVRPSVHLSVSTLFIFTADCARSLFLLPELSPLWRAAVTAAPLSECRLKRNIDNIFATDLLLRPACHLATTGDL